MTAAHSSTQAAHSSRQVAHSSTTTVMTAAHSSTQAVHSSRQAAHSSTQQLTAARSMQAGSSQQLTVALCISHMYIYEHKHMYITHLAALSLSCSFQRPAALSRAYNVYTQPPFQAPEIRRFNDTDTHRKTCIGSRSCVRVLVKAFVG